MLFAYIDESKFDNKFYVYSAVVAESDAWNEAFLATKEMRYSLKNNYGIYIKKELHAWKFAAGKGQIANHPIDKKSRAAIYCEILSFIAKSGFFRVLSSVNTNELYAFERLINRINRTADAQKTNAILICDEGQEAVFTRRIRRMRVFNGIPSNQGAWNTGEMAKNIPTRFIIEDPFFKESSSSYFVQLADFVAYALLRMELPIPSRTELGYDKMYEILEPCVVKAAAPRDPKGLGIIR